MTANTLKQQRSLKAKGSRTKLKVPDIFKASVKGKTSGERKTVAVAMASLMELIPIRNLDATVLKTFAAGKHAELYTPGSVIFREGETLDSVLYLLAGTVLTESEAGRRQDVSSGTAESRFPLSRGDVHVLTVTAKTDVTVLRVSKHLMTYSEGTDSEIDTVDADMALLPDELQESAIFQGIFQNYRHEDLVLKTLPPITDLIQRAMKRDISVKQMSRLIEMDPALAAKVLSVANSPLYLKTGTITSISDAVSEFGLSAAQVLVKSCCEQFALKSQTNFYAQNLQLASSESLLTSGLCYALANLTQTVDPRTALLAGLMTNIGLLPFFDFVDNFPNEMYSAKQIEMGKPFVRGVLGNYVLAELGFPEELSMLPALAENWHYDSGNSQLDLTDILILSRLHVQLVSENKSALPPVKNIPAVKKLGGKGLTSELSRMLLQTANKRVSKPRSVVEAGVMIDSDMITAAEKE